MKEITQIKKIGNGNRYHLYLDEQHFGIFEAEVLARYCLKSGQSYDDDFFETVTVSAGVLRKDDTAEETIHISEIAFDRGFEVLSIEGDLA